MRWACLYCGYVYDEALGCPESGIPPGTGWDDLPEDWCCPMCSADKDGFAAAAGEQATGAEERN